MLSPPPSAFPRRRPWAYASRHRQHNIITIKALLDFSTRARVSAGAGANPKKTSKKQMKCKHNRKLISPCPRTSTNDSRPSYRTTIIMSNSPTHVRPLRTKEQNQDEMTKHRTTPHKQPPNSKRTLMFSPSYTCRDSALPACACTAASCACSCARTIARFVDRTASGEFCAICCAICSAVGSTSAGGTTRLTLRLWYAMQPHQRLDDNSDTVAMTMTIA